MVRSLLSEPSDKQAIPPPDGAVTNEMLLRASTWPLAYDIRNNHIRCGSCRQSVQSLGHNNIGYTSNVQTILGLVVMHMIQTHGFTREGAIENG